MTEPEAATLPAAASRLRSHLPAVLLGVFFAALWSWMLLANYASFSNYDRDVAIYSQVLWNTGRGHPFETTSLVLNRSHLAEHVAPLLIPLAVLYQVAPRHEWLIVFQQVGVALAGAPIYLFARRGLGGTWPPLLVLASFYLAPVMTNITYLNFHPVALAMLPIGFGAYFMLTDRPRLGTLVACSTLLVEETSAMALLGLGLVLLLRRHIRWGALVVGIATAWLVLVTLVVMPSFHLAETIPEEGNRTLAKFGALERGLSGVAALIVARGPTVIQQFLLPNAGLALLAPHLLIAVIPSFPVLLFLNDPDDLVSHRAAPTMVLIWLATVQGLAWLRDRQRNPGAAAPRPGPSPLASWPLHLGLGALVGLSVVSHFANNRLPLGGRFSAAQLEWTSRSTALARAVEEVPPGVSVGASSAAANHLAERRELYFFPTTYADALWPPRQRLQWWVLDLSSQVLRDNVVERIGSPLRADPPYRLHVLDGLVLVAHDRITLPVRALQARFGETLLLEGADVRRTTGGAEARLHWRLIQPATVDYVRRLELVTADGAVLFASEGPATNRIYGTSQWRPGQILIEETRMEPDPAPDTQDLRLRVRWSHPATGQPLLLADGASYLELEVPSTLRPD